MAGGFGILAGIFLGVLVQRVSWLPLSLVLLGALLLINMSGGPLRLPLLVLNALALGLLSLPLMLNGSGVILLIGCIFAVTAIFYRPPTEAAVPGWLRDTRHGRRRRAGSEEKSPTDPEDGPGLREGEAPAPPSAAP